MAADRLAVLDAARVRLPLLVVAGVVGALAYPGVNWWMLGWIFLVPAFLCAMRRSPRGALADGWLLGTAFFLVLLRWLDHTFGHYSAIPWPLSWLPIAALAGYCGLYVGAAAAVTAWLVRRLGPGPALAMIPPAWVAGEWVRGHLMGGFPWGLLGYSQHGVLLVIQVAELGGVYAVSFVMAAVGSAIAGALGLGLHRARVGILLAFLLLLASLGFGWHALARPEGAGGEPVGPRVAVIQPSVDQTVKWSPAHHAEILARYEALTRSAALSRPALIVWPETAAAFFLRGDPALVARLTALAAEVGAPLLVGSVDRVEGPAGAFLNSAFLLTGRGVGEKYDKIHLVPFGEYVPLSRLIGFVRSWAEFISDFAAGERITVFPLPGASFGTVICYEVIFPELFRAFVAAGAEFMTNITNDAWFGETSGPWQHLAMVPFRAVENRVTIVRAANTGVSAIVEPSGRVASLLPLHVRGVLDGAVARRRRHTLYTRMGDWFAYGCLGVSGAALGLAYFRRESR